MLPIILVITLMMFFVWLELVLMYDGLSLGFRYG